jgi:hypothetical protein
MAEDHSPILDIVGGVSEVTLPEVSVTGSSSEDSSGEGPVIMPKLRVKIPWSLICANLDGAMTSGPQPSL